MTGLERYRYIAIEGPIGAGKTSLARKLSDYLRADLLLEDPSSNPFLSRFYEEGARHALATQLFFLFQRAEQTRDLKQQELFARPVVADFLLDKDSLFAQMNLDDDEFILYQQIYQHLQPQAPRPDLVIYLQAPPAILLDRVRQRGVAYEENMSFDYLARLADSYAHFFHHYEAAPLLIVDSEHINFAHNPADVELLVSHMKRLPGGREYLSRR